jgi:hypothetical protein
MTRASQVFRCAAIALVAASLALSCATTPKSSVTPDEKLIAQGQSSWNSKGPESARPYWSELQDGAVRKTYVGYIDTYAELMKGLDDAAAVGIDDQSRFLTAFESAEKTYSSFPGELKLPEEAKTKAVRIAADRARALLDAKKPQAARELAQSALSAFGESTELTALEKEAEILIASQKSEGEADAALSKARGRDDFYAKIGGYQDAIAAYAKAGSSLSENAKGAGATDSKAVAAQSARLEKKGQDARIEMERRLRERQYSFKDRIGEEFAKVPAGDKLGSMSLDEILAYQEGIKANVEKDYQEMKDFGEKFPAVIDKDMLKEVEDQKDALDQRIAQVQAEIRTAKDIASRGKTVMPVMIGLFNPVPGDKKGDQKSRPAVFRGTSRGGSDYWWGMAAIPKGTLNDLVVSVNGDRTVRVFAENTKSGARIGEKGVKDIVNKGYKVGNMWPVLNAGSQLASGNYFFEVQGGKTADYDGEVVIYSSYIARVR